MGRVFTVLLCLAVAIQAELKCNIRYYGLQPKEYAEFGEGLVMGLFERPPLKRENCELC